ncbi:MULTISPECIES: YjiH family protein [unclassified Staphylococcus]|uniref:YjiH family protein n=1 Tax=unclassified Staphylococcus TaxID=91994 RepID=UPI0021D20E48|nr:MULTISPECIES: YjiH family protein [unclassified Staphylococcus]UXR71252.1 YjiH family protein [Staphylococcus sp. IVB6240]UXR75844.1 YjiH family protein [Staphylococcus sp. IVB6233]UXR80042.1 YjiH family protein [Staphylococcus sp. IVB6218]
MNQLTKQQKKVGKWKFLLLSLIGIILFLVPVPIVEDGQRKTTLPVAFLAGIFKETIGGLMPILIIAIITVSGILTILYSIVWRNKKDLSEFMVNMFKVTWPWVIVRLFAIVFAWLTFLQVGPKWITSEDTGALIFADLLPTLVAVFFFAAIFLPLLLEYGLLEFLGPIFRPIMRPLFTLPGRSTVDNLASFIGDGTVGVMITSKQYEQGFYTRREATVIATTFSVVSLTFAIVIAETIGLIDCFAAFYFTVIVACFVAALIMPRIWPLRSVEDNYVDGVSAKERPEKRYSYKEALAKGFEDAVETGYHAPGLRNYFYTAVRTVMDMWLVVIPVVMAIGTAATILATYTPIFGIIGKPFVPFLEILQVPEAAAASETMIIGFADMFLPSILIEGVQSDLTRFVVGVLSVCQLIYLSEVGGVILGSKIPVSLGKLFLIFLIRTIITLPVIVLFAHIFF